jgi:hypothetical protein
MKADHLDDRSPRTLTLLLPPEPNPPPMRPYRLVGPSYWDVFAFLWIGVGLIPVVITVVMWLLKWSPSVILVGVGGGAIGFVIGGLRFAYLFFKRQWLQETDGGFKYHDWRKEYTFTANRSTRMSRA